MRKYKLFRTRRFRIEAHYRQFDRHSHRMYRWLSHQIELGKQSLEDWKPPRSYGQHELLRRRLIEQYKMATRPRVKDFILDSAAEFIVSRLDDIYSDLREMLRDKQGPAEAL